MGTLSVPTADDLRAEREAADRAAAEDLRAQREVIGAIVAEPDRSRAALNHTLALGLRSRAFNDRAYALIFAAFERLGPEVAPDFATTHQQIARVASASEASSALSKMIEARAEVSTSANLEHWARAVLEAAARREREAAADAEAAALRRRDYEEAARERARREQASSLAITTHTLAAEMEHHRMRWAARLGREHVGLAQRTLPKLDSLSNGLRGFVLLPGAPNVGKTALGIQLGLDVVRANEDAVFVCVSLEMPRAAIIDRLRSRRAELPWNILAFGSTRTTGGCELVFTADEWQRINDADAELADLGRRILIIERDVSADALIMAVRRLQRETGCGRAIVLIDYLQIWPAPEGARSDIEQDRWRVGELRRITNALGAEENVVLVISEARKPRSNDAWGGDLSDVMGSARATYSPDAVLLLYPSTARQLGIDSAQLERDQEDRAEAGHARVTLEVRKGRDGWERGAILLDYDFARSSFEQAAPTSASVRATRSSSPQRPARQERQERQEANGQHHHPDGHLAD